jgi:neutral amino acid transport system permease protein
VQNIIFGLITGSILASATVGFALIRQTENFLHIAHGQTLALGAYVGFVLVDRGLNIFLAGVLAMIAIGALGVFMGRVVFTPVADQGGTVLLFTSIGMAFLLYGAIIAIFGTNVEIFPVGFGTNYEFGGASISFGELVIIVLATASILGLQGFLTFTRMGRWLRASASNPELAAVRGVPVRLVSSVVWFISSALAAMAGIMLGVLGTVNTELGWANILVILAAAVLGGLGSILGVMASAFLLGLVMDLSALWIPTSYRSIIAFGLLIAVLLIRPEGLFSVGRRAESIA